MRLYLDSFDITEMMRLLPSGLFAGVTTNPLLAERAGLIYSQICWDGLFSQLDETPISECHIQLPDTTEAALDFALMIQKKAADYSFTPVIKIPLTAEGVQLTPAIQKMGLPVLMTACTHAKQMFVAQALQADYIAPYFGRMEEAGRDGRAHLSQMKAIASTAARPCRILVASLRSVDQMCMLAEDGHEYMTISPALADSLLYDELTCSATEDFIRAAQIHQTRTETV